jgi:hypothetical protein
MVLQAVERFDAEGLRAMRKRVAESSYGVGEIK